MSYGNPRPSRMTENFSESKDRIFEYPPSSSHANMAGTSKGYSSGAAPGVDEKKVQLEHLESIDSTKPKVSKRLKLRQHWKRFWCCYLIAFIVGAAIFLPLFFLKVIPAIAQDIVNNTNLPIYGGSLKAVSDDQVIVALSTALDVPAGLTVTMDPFELFLYNADSSGFYPYTSVNLPSESVSGHTVIRIENQVVSVGNRTELNLFLQKMIFNKTADISVSADTTAHLGAIKAPIHLGKTVTVNALNQLSGVNLDNIKIVLPPEEDGTNLIGNFTLPNWSDLDIGLGNLTFNAWSGNVIIGNVTILNVDLPPGNSTLPFRGQIFIDTLVKNIGSIISSQASVLSTGNLVVGISGNRTIINGEHITYLENVLNNIKIYTEVPIIQALGDVLDSVSGSDPTTDLGGILGLIEQLLGSGGPLSGLLGSLGNLTSSLNLSTVVNGNPRRAETLKSIQEAVVLPI